MRVWILIACLFSFSAGSFADLAHAAMADTICAHHETEVVDVDPACADDNHTHNDDNDCQDCCCIHTHILAGSFMSVSNEVVRDRMASMPYDRFVSIDASPLYRPPIA